MMYRLWRYDVFRYAQNDVTRFTRNDAMFALMCLQANIIEKRPSRIRLGLFFLSRGYEKDIFRELPLGFELKRSYV